MDIDLTLLIQLTIFAAILVSLNGVLFRPFLHVIQTRYERIEGMRAKAEELTQVAENKQAEYEAVIQKARLEALKAREALVAAGREEERRLLADARSDVSAKLQDARAIIEAKEKAAQAELADKTGGLALTLVGKILGREVSA